MSKQSKAVFAGVISVLFVSGVARGGQSPAAPAQLELVFPVVQQGNVALQNRQLIFDTEFAIANPVDEDAFVEIAFFDGNSANPRAQSGVVASARTSTTVPLPRVGAGTAFRSGWARVRANQPLTVEQRLLLRDPAVGDSFITLQGLPQPLGSAELPAFFNIGNPVRNTGVSIVNPRPQPLTVRVDLLRHRLRGKDVVAEREVTLGPFARLDLVAAVFFGDVDPDQLAGPDCDFLCSLGIVRVSAENGRQFAAEAVDFLVGSSFHDHRVTTLSYQASSRFDVAGVEQRILGANADLWGFPLGVVSSAFFGGRRLTLTAFHLEVADGETAVRTPVSLGERLLIDETAGVAVAAGDREKVVLLAERSSPFRVPLAGTVEQVLNFPEQNAFEIEAVFTLPTGIANLPVFNHVLIDRESGEVLDRFVFLFIGGDVPSPPWRQ